MRQLILFNNKNLDGKEYQEEMTPLSGVGALLTKYMYKHTFHARHKTITKIKILRAT